PAFTAVPAAPQTMTAFERADPPLASGAPAECGAGDPRALLTRLPRQHDMPDAPIPRSALVTARREPAVGHGQLRGALHKRDVSIQGRLPQGPLALARIHHGVVRDELCLGLLDLHEPAELRGVRQLALADDVRVRFEEADHLVRVMRVPPEDPRSRL